MCSIYMSTTDISDKIKTKLEKTVTNKTELDMILDMLGNEERWSKENKQQVKRQLQLLIQQYFPLDESKNE